MLLPRYSLRTIFYLAVLVAVLAIVVGQAVQGTVWAVAISIAVASLVVTWGVYVLLYGIVVGFARVALPAGMRKPKPAYYPAWKQSTPTDSTLPAADASDSRGPHS